MGHDVGLMGGASVEAPWRGKAPARPVASQRETLRALSWASVLLSTTRAATPPSRWRSPFS